MIARIRKAVTAGFGAGVGAAGVVIAKDVETGTLGETTAQQAIGAFVATAAVVGWSTWRVPNAKA